MNGKYSSTEPCSKCGSCSHKVVWYKKKTYSLPDMYSFTIPEHMSVECGICGYTWQRFTRDSDGTGFAKPTDLSKPESSLTQSLTARQLKPKRPDSNQV